MQLQPSCRLKVGFTNPGSDADPCDPQASGGYLGADNQLIRVRVDHRGGGTNVLWGFDDASFIYRITQVTNGDTLTLAADPPDPNHFPVTGQFVEILTTASMLGEEPDESDPFHQAQILRVVAEAQGTVRQLSQPYGPLPGSTTNVIVLSNPLPGHVADSPLPLFMRVWQGRHAIDPSGGTVTLETTTTDSTTGTSTTVSTGVTATISGAPLADGAYWEIAVRPSTPQGVYPEELLTAPQPPVGPRRWACPLAVIDWSNENVTDCRSQFQNLVELSRRRPGCCSVSIGPRDVTAGTSLQALIDAAVALADRVTVCLQPGVYRLPGTLYFDGRHTGLTLEGCGGPVILTYQALDDLTPFLDGIIAVDRVAGVTLEGLTIRPPIVESTVAFFETLRERLDKDGFAEAERIFRRPFLSFGIRALNAPRLTITGCVFVIAANVDAAKGVDRTEVEAEAEAKLTTLADVFAAAIFLRGDCIGATIADCVARSTITPTHTSLSVDRKEASPNSFKIFNDLLVTRLAQPAASLDLEVDPALASPPAGASAEAEAKIDEERDFLAVPASPPASARAAAAARAAPLAEAAAPERLVGQLADAPAQDIAPAAPPPPAPAPDPSPPVSASPPTEFELLDQQVSDSLDLVAAKRLAVGAVAPRYVIITVGVLAAGSLDGATALGKTIVAGCQLEGFTFATWFSAQMSILRLEENTVTNGVAGLWLEVVDAGPVPGASVRTPYYQSTILFEEYQLLVALAATLPAPTPPSTVRPLILELTDEEEVIDSPGLFLRQPPPYSLVVSGNQVDVRPQTADLGASAAMLLALYREGEIQPLTSIMVQSNRLCGGTAAIVSDRFAQGTFDQATPAALITLPASTSCAVNGNVVINRGGVEASADAVAPSLWFTIADSVDGADQLAVTGNVLKGVSDLSRIRRRSRSRGNWSIYNADPS
jgi:hypothetical protein